MSASRDPAVSAVPAALPDLPRDAEGPIFREPWEAQAFAMAVALHDRGVFSWGEWAEKLGAEIKCAQAAGDPDRGDTYYHHWLRALERMVAEKGIARPATLESLQDAWDRAAKATPHGKPILLPSKDLAKLD